MVNEKKKRRKKRRKNVVQKKKISFKPIIKPAIILGIIGALLLAGILIISRFQIKKVIVEGNVHYTSEEIQEMVLGGRWGKNTLYVAYKYQDKQVDDIPFIETLDVEIVSTDTVKITVYEKAMAGYIEYMGQYFYFDKDGTIVESSNIKTLGIPQIMGLSFDHIVLKEKLPVEDEDVFKQILDITQLLNKYGVAAEKIYFDNDRNKTLYYGDVRVNLGNSDYMEEKIMKVKAILPELDGKKGVLRLENYKADSSSVSFELDEEKQ